MSSIRFYRAGIANILKKLYVNKAEGSDGNHPRVLFKNSKVFAYPLKLIFETSSLLNKLPLDWRSDNITSLPSLKR